MDLFECGRREQLKKEAPLALRMRPRKLEEFVGQEAVVGAGKLLRRAIEEDRISSLILYGPAGSGKTTLAMIIAATTNAHFTPLNAVTAGVAEVRQVVREARERRTMYGQKTVLFIDEIHRFNQAQQDALLPYVEDGTVVLVGATARNPFVDVIPALVSRSSVFHLEPLRDEDIRTILARALRDEERGLGRLKVEVNPAALEHIVQAAGGDARIALNALEMAVLGATPQPDGRRVVTVELAEEATGKKVLAYDREGDQHYDTISAFIKSMRGSDPDAAVYWLARMLYAGEDPRFIARRMIIHAAEDVGLADPRALLVAVAAAQALEMVGLPEARLPLAEAAVYIAAAPKSNAVYRAIEEAWKDVEGKKAGPVPLHLRDSSYRGASRLGHGVDYLYPHEYPGHWVKQDYLPDGLQGRIYYRPGDQGEEAGIRQQLEARGKKY